MEQVLGKKAWQRTVAFSSFRNMELYDIETNSEAYKKQGYLADANTEASSPEAMVEAVYRQTKNYITRNKL